MRKSFLSIILFLIILLAYWDLPKTFFQQDEWQSLAAAIYYQSISFSGIVQSFLPSDAISHFNPLAKIYEWFTFLFFYTNFEFYAWLSIGVHAINTFLLYYFVLLTFQNRKLAFFAAILFGVNSIASQAVTWVAAINSYEIPTVFILLSLIFFHRFLRQKEHRNRNVLFSFSLLFISLLFHEIGIFLLIFYPLIFFLYTKSEWRKLFPALLYSLLLFIFAFFLIRVPFFFGFTTTLPVVTDISRPSVTVYPYRLVSIAMKSFAGSLIPERTLIEISQSVVYLGYPQYLTADNLPNPFITQSIVFDLTSYMFTVIIVCIIIFCIKLTRDKKLKDALFWALLFVPASLIPYGFVLGKAGYASILEPKFFYVGSIGISILVAAAAYSLLIKFSKQKILKTIVYFLLGLYFVHHLMAVKTNSNNLVEIGTQRKEFLTNIKSSYKKLPQNAVFFTQSDTAYYGMPDDERILPVQIGFGKMLMIWYQKDERFPGCLYEGQFLLPLLEEGYRSCGGRGFGYFRNYDKLIDTIKTNNIKVESVIAYSWNGKSEKLEDITSEIRTRIKIDLENK